MNDQPPERITADDTGRRGRLHVVPADIDPPRSDDPEDSGPILLSW
jgi:hypothetical protein